MSRHRTRVFLASSSSHSVLFTALFSGLVVFCIVVMLFSPWVDTLACLLAFGVSDIGATVLRQGPSHGLPCDSDVPHPGHHGSNATILHGGIASESTICSGIGRDLLLRGGTAADAMVGATFCVGVIGMYHSGIGGGGFMLVRGTDGEYEFIDFRESAPAAAFQDMYKNNTNASIYGGLARYVWHDWSISSEHHILTSE
jgi:gamma-glutamyltranspeptidase/glutathione hydrolase